MAVFEALISTSVDNISPLLDALHVLVEDNAGKFSQENKLVNVITTFSHHPLD